MSLEHPYIFCKFSVYNYKSSCGFSCGNIVTSGKPIKLSFELLAHVAAETLLKRRGERRLVYVAS